MKLWVDARYPAPDGYVWCKNVEEAIGLIGDVEEYLGIDTIGNVSINLVESMLTNVSEMSYRKVSHAIKTMCNQNISPQGVWNVVQTVGSKIKDMENPFKNYFCLY